VGILHETFIMSLVITKFFLKSYGLGLCPIELPPEPIVVTIEFVSNSNKSSPNINV
jgi:hypothetical protein